MYKYKSINFEGLLSQKAASRIRIRLMEAEDERSA